MCIHSNDEGHDHGREVVQLVTEIISNLNELDKISKKLLMNKVRQENETDENEADENGSEENEGKRPGGEKGEE